MDDTTPLVWIERLASLSLFLVAIGVVGELIAHRLERPIRSRQDTAKELEIAQLKKATADANQAAAQASERAANAERDAQTERLERTKIENRLAWRRVDKETHDSLVSMLKPYAGTTISVVEMGDIEARTFGADIVKVFHDAGWTVQLAGVGIASPPPYGLQCSVNENLPGGKVLAEALRRLPTAKVEVNGSRTTVGEVFVALKPPA
jgi:hypothetical protein